MSLLRHDDVLFYHPLDDHTEYIKNHVWDDVQANMAFSGGIINSGWTRDSTSSSTYTEEALADGGYTDIDGATRITACFWASGFYKSDSEYKTFYIGFEDSTTVKNTFKLQKTNTDAITLQLRIRGNSLDTKNIPSHPTDADWNFVVLDVEKEGTDWRYRVSFNGENWQDLGTATYDALPNTNLRTIIDALDNASDRYVVDEVVFWKDAKLFTNQELSNIYELANTYGQPMHQYTSIYGTPANSGINLFVQGHIDTSGDISLYIPSQKDIKTTDLFTNGSIQISGNINLYISGIPPIASSSINLYTIAPTPTSGNINLYTIGPLSTSGNIGGFIYGYQISTGNIDQHIHGKSTTSSNIDLYISGIPVISSSINLYTVGPILINDNISNFIWGHLPTSGNINLYIKGLFPTFDVFLSVVDNNPSNNLNLFTHGVPSGESTTFYINDTITLFINDSGDDNTVDSSWFAFTKVADAILIPSSGTWQSFVKGGNAINNNINLYINSHASGESPHGTLISDLITIFINGQATQDGDEGLLSDGYYVIGVETFAFAKVYFGVIDTLDLYVSGEIIPIPPLATLDLFTFGVSGTVSDLCTLYIPSKKSINDICDLFIFGIQDTKSENLLLYLEVTSLGSLDRKSILYTHGF